MSPLAGLAVIPSGNRTPSGSTAKVSTSRSMNNRLELPSASAGPAVTPIENKTGIARAARFFFMSPPRVGMASKKKLYDFLWLKLYQGSEFHRGLRRDA